MCVLEKLLRTDGEYISGTQELTYMTVPDGGVLRTLFSAVRAEPGLYRRENERS